MSIYYLSPVESQESCASFTAEITPNGDRQNECFATNSNDQNTPAALTAPDVGAIGGSEGLVTYETTPALAPTPTPTTSHQPSIIPGHIALGKEWLSNRPKPRGRHARKPAPVTKAAVRLSREEKKEVIGKRASDREAVAFSLNFSPKKIAQVEASSDPARIIYNEINRSAKTILGFPLSVSFEFDVDDDNRLHCHGTAILPDLSTETVAKFRQVLKRAGGMMLGEAGARQVDVRRLKNWKGWAGYQHKNVDRVIERLGTDKVHYTSRELKRVAFGDHDADLFRRKRRKTTQERPCSAEAASPSLTTHRSRKRVSGLL